MPRDSNGNYTLPSGNPVVTGTVVSSTWANPTMGDVAAELTNSLDRQGRGGMLAPFKFLDGTVSAPGMTWTSEPSTGFYRAGASDMRATVAGVPRQRWIGTGTDVWDPTANAGAGAWFALVNGSGLNIPLLNNTNIFSKSQVIAYAGVSAGWYMQDNALSPTKGARLSFNLAYADQLDLSVYHGGAWNAKFAASASVSSHFNDEHTFNTADLNTKYAQIDNNGLNAYGARGVVFNNAANTLNRIIKMNASDELMVNGRGGLLHWSGGTLASGEITVGTATPPATGAPGVMALVYE